MSWWRRLLYRDRMEAQLDAELRDHFERLVAEFTARGRTVAEARRLARLELGGFDQLKEACRDVRGTRGLEELAQDVRYGIRGLRKQPAFTIAAVLTLALGTGANLAVFNLVDALLLRPLPVPEAGQLIKLTRWMDSHASDHFSYPQILLLAERHDVFASLCGIGSDTVFVGLPDALEPAGAAWVSGGYFETLRVTPHLGRLLGRSDDAPAASPAAVITYGYWQRRFGGDRDVVGRTLLIEGQQVPIVGVTPEGFDGATVGERADITFAIAARPVLQPENGDFLDASARWLRVLARPEPGLPAGQLQARVDVVWRQVLDATIPSSMSAAAQERARSMTLTVDPGATGTSRLRADLDVPLMAGMGFVTLVLLIACVNVANLLMARGATRAREVALRLALGAARARVIRQFLVESALLACAGAAVGTLLGWAASRALVDIVALAAGGPDASLVAVDVAPNWRIIAVTLALVIGTTFTFGAVPAFKTSAVAPGTIATNSVRLTESHATLTSALIVAQVSLSLVLIVGAGLFARSLYTLRALDPGFRPGRVLLASVNPTRARLSSADLQAFNQSLLDTVSQLPGVGRVSSGAVTPLEGGGMSNSMVLNGVPSGLRETYFNVVGPGYFEIMGTALVAGRDFTRQDAGDAPAVAVVNEAFMREFAPGADPFAQKVRMSGSDREMQVVGVVRDAAYESLRLDAPATIYIPFLQSRGRPMTLVIDTVAPMAEVASAVRAAIQPTVPASPVHLRTFAAQIDGSLVRERLMRLLTVVFSVLALLLVAVGVYGLMSFSVATRTREIGVRLALGASPQSVLAMVLRSALRLVAFGVIAGVPAAWLASRLVRRLIYGLGPADLVVAAIAVAIVIGVGVIAAALPARRAARLDPVSAIHVE